MSRSVDELATRLGLPVERLALLEGHDEADVAVLADAVGLAVLAEDRAVEDGLAAALRMVPLPLRGRARALLLGDDDA